MTTRRMTILVHGFSGAGKSTFAATAPGPVLILDAESGSDYLDDVVYWNPTVEPPPEDDGKWRHCVVNVLDYETVVRAYEYLANGDHPFKSVVLDSVSEIQQRCIDAIAGSNQMRTQDWGELLRTVSGQIRKFRDLKSHPTNPLWAIVFVCMTDKVEGKQLPLVQGKLRSFLPYYVDACGWLYADIDDFGKDQRHLLIGTDPMYEAKERLGGRLPRVIDNPNISAMLKALNEKEGK